MKKIRLMITVVVIASYFLSACSPMITPYQASSGKLKKGIVH